MKETVLKGLNPEEVTASRERHGHNVLTPPKRESVWKLFIEKFNDPIIKILLVAAFLSLGIAFIDGEFAETIGIFCAILLATGVSFWFEYDAKRRFEILNTVNDDTPVKVVRGGEVMEIPKRDVVVGDIVLLASGDEVPADGRLLEARALKVNESTLTGETVADKTTDPEQAHEESTYPHDMVLRGTTVVEGSGVMRVEAVGDATEQGKVSELATATTEEPTPLNKQLTRLSHIIGRIGGGLAVAIFLILVAKGLFIDGTLREGGTIHILSQILNYFMVSVAVMVMSIPEGLPMSITLSLAINMRRMLRSNNLVRKMHASETMGAVTVICTDKTGTLTRNEMRVAGIDRYGNAADEVFEELVAVNSASHLDHNGKVIGNPTDGALLMWLADNGSDYKRLREGAPIIDRINFSSERKFMATLVDSPVTGKRMLYVKGAPEIVRSMCGEAGPEGEITEKLQGYQNRAMRTIGMAVAETSADDCDKAIKEHNLRFIAIAAIADPVRDDVPEAVCRCLSAGIQVKIVTGDVSATAREIARQIGLWNDETDGDRNIMTGPEFEAASDEELLERIGDLKIMSRARPFDKQRLVRLLQAKGEVVAVTGDGTNDAPALNFAQVGLSMGTGTSVAKEASDITLIDDSFSSIATAVMWGRSLYKNIQRFVMFQLTVNFAALVVVFFGSVFGNEMPLTVTQILWVNLIMDTFAAMALASLPPDPEVMNEKPRKNSDFIISRGMLGWILGVGAVMVAVLLGLLFQWGDAITPYQLSAFFTVFVMMQFWNLFNARAYGMHRAAGNRMGGNGGFLLVLLVILAGQWFIVEFGGEVFRTVPLTWPDWGYIIACTATIAVGGWFLRVSRRLFLNK